MYRSDKTIFNAAELPKTKPVVLIYFDPDCEHCQKLMKELFQKIDAFKKAEIIMVTFKPIEEVAAFEKLNNTQKHSNIIVGTEGLGFYLRNYYGLVTMPFTALYDKKGQFKLFVQEGNIGRRSNKPFKESLDPAKRFYRDGN